MKSSGAVSLCISSELRISYTHCTYTSLLCKWRTPHYSMGVKNLYKLMYSVRVLCPSIGDDLATPHTGLSKHHTNVTVLLMWVHMLAWTNHLPQISNQIFHKCWTSVPRALARVRVKGYCETIVLTWHGSEDNSNWSSHGYLLLSYLIYYEGRLLRHRRQKSMYGGWRKSLWVKEQCSYTAEAEV